MTEQELIQIEIICTNYNCEVNFVHELHSFGLIEIHKKDDVDWIHIEELSQFEKMIRLHRELNVNLEGIDIILNLLNKSQSLEDEVASLKNRLRLYENDL